MMEHFFIHIALLLAILAPVFAKAGDLKVLSMPFSRHKRHPIEKRASSFSVAIENDYQLGLYYVDASVGTPAQAVQLQIDTGSSDVWFFGPNSCNASTSPCEGGLFNPSDSSTVEVIGQGKFQIHYETPDSGVSGNYIQDTFAIGPASLTSLTMAVATQAAYVPAGIMGIGFDKDEAIVSEGGNPYPNLIDEMVTQNFINSRAYSLWLDDLRTSTFITKD